MDGYADVWLVTHGPKNEGPDPTMTLVGAAMVIDLGRYLPPTDKIPEVWTGEARRHENVAIALGLNHHPNRWYSAIWGAVGSLEVRGESKVLVLADGRAVPFERTTSGQDAGPSVQVKMVKLPHNTVICAGRETLLALGLSLTEAKSAALYCIRHNGHRILEIRLVTVGSAPPLPPA